jgi:hypothetical protein
MKPRIFKVSYLIWAMSENDAVSCDIYDGKITEVIEFKLEAS